MSNYITEAALKTLVKNAAAVRGSNTVISAAVTGRLEWLKTVTPEAVAAAGKTSLNEYTGIIRNDYDLFFSGGMSGKMDGMPGLSGYAGNNPECLKRALFGFGICYKCFSFLTPWKPSILAWTKNDILLSSGYMDAGAVRIDPEKLPYMRFSSHGDTINAVHVYNYCRIAYDNPNTQFALWTKNAAFFRDGLKEFGRKPENLTTIYSPLLMNCRPSEKALKAAAAAGYDAVFSVSDVREKQTAAIAGGAYGCLCGPGSCRGKCLFCYDADRRTAAGYDGSRAVLISEILDGERHREK